MCMSPAHAVVIRCGAIRRSAASYCAFGRRLPTAMTREYASTTAPRTASPSFYVRQLLADFDACRGAEAWQLKARDLPFGFEFIARVDFS